MFALLICKYTKVEKIKRKENYSPSNLFEIIIKTIINPTALNKHTKDERATPTPPQVGGKQSRAFAEIFIHSALVEVRTSENVFPPSEKIKKFFAKTKSVPERKQKYL